MSYWIPVTERLPARGQRVLAWGGDACFGGEKHRIAVCDEHVDWMGREFFGLPTNVTHWQPLPPPPPPEADDE